MNSSMHPVEQEKVMAYLDGELPVERAAGVAAHLEHCAECQALAAELRSVSQQMTAWQVESSPARLTERVTAALEKHPQEPPAFKGYKAFADGTARSRPLVRRWVLGLAGAFVLFLLLAAISIPNLLRSRIASNQALRAPVVTYHMEEAGAPSEAQPARPQTPAGPMIVRTGALTVVAKEFESARAAMDRIVREHQGYIAQLTVTGQAGAGRALMATVRVPANQLDPVLAEFKKLGRVEQESQSGEEVTRQYVDLGARLSNARNTEQRLTEVLRQRAGKMADILAVEREIARVREEIERMDAERRTLENQVRFASVQLRISEEYQAQLEVAPPSTGTRLRNAAVEGYRGFVESAVGLALFLLSYGLSLLFWGLLLFWPARFAWRRLRA